MNTTAPEPGMTSRVVACKGGAATAIEQRQVPSPGPGELLLGLRAVGLCGTDLFKLDSGGAAPGSVLGHELVGEVLLCGEGVTGFGPGDRVAVPHHVPCGSCAKCRMGNETLCEVFRENLMEPGGFSDLILIRSRAVAHAARRLPAHLSDEVAVWMEPAACVLRGIERSGIEARAAVGALSVVLGAGSMGLLHLLVLKAVSPDARVLAIDPEPARRALARTLGADASCDPAGAPAAVRGNSAGLGADVVFDTVGGAARLDAAIGMSREGGSIVLFAHAAEGDRARFDINALFKHERRIIGTYSGTPAQQQRVFELMTRGRLDPSVLVTHRMDLSDFDDAVQLVRQRKALKVVFSGRPAAADLRDPLTRLPGGGRSGAGRGDAP